MNHDGLSGDYNSPFFDTERIYSGMFENTKSSTSNALDNLLNNYKIYIKDMDDLIFGTGFKKIFRKIVYGAGGNISKDAILEKIKTSAEYEIRHSDEIINSMTKDYDRVKNERKRLEAILRQSEIKYHAYEQDRDKLKKQYEEFMKLKNEGKLSSSDSTIQGSRLINNLYLNSMKYKQAQSEFRYINATYKIANIAENIFTTYISALNQFSMNLKSSLEQVALITSNMPVEEIVKMFKNGTKLSELINTEGITRLRLAASQMQDFKQINETLLNKDTLVKASQEAYSEMSRQQEDFISKLDESIAEEEGKSLTLDDD